MRIGKYRITINWIVVRNNILIAIANIIFAGGIGLMCAFGIGN